MASEPEARDIAAALARLGLPEHATAHEVHSAYSRLADDARAAGDDEVAAELRAAYALLRRRPGTGGGRGARRVAPEAATAEPPPARATRPVRKASRGSRPSVSEVLDLVDRRQFAAAVQRVCEQDWHRAVADRGPWEDTVIRLACCTRWTAPGAYKLLHDHHGAVLARPALGHLSSAYVAIADTTTAWTGWHEFRNPDPRLVEFFERSLCGSTAARRALLESIGEWIARDRHSFLEQLEGIASISDRLLSLLVLMCDQLRDDLRLDLAAPVDPEKVAQRLEVGFPPSARMVGVGVVAGGAVLGGPRAFLPALFGGGLLATMAEQLVTVLMNTRRRAQLLDLCLETGVSVQGLAEWAGRQDLLSRARPWSAALLGDRVLHAAFTLERLTRHLDRQRARSMS